MSVKQTAKLIKNIVGIKMNLAQLAVIKLTGSPLTFNNVGPSWLKENPSNYAKKAKLDPQSAKIFKEITSKKKGFITKHSKKNYKK